MKYLCKRCGAIVQRDSKKAWVKSYCAGKNVRLMRQPAKRRL
jgi:DNA-directed RNA polymerase subunit RPC12/RpoP